MSMTLQEMQSQQTLVRLRQKNGEGVDEFLQCIADGFLVLLEENKQRGKQLEALSREIARLPLSPAAEISCRPAEGNKEAVCRRLEEISLEITALRAEIARRPEVKNQPAEELHLPPAGCAKPPERNSSCPAARPPAEIPRPAPPRKGQRESGVEPTAATGYTFANLLYRANDFLSKPARRRLFFSGNLEHVPLLPVLAIIFFQQHLLPAFARVAMSLG
jgi:hypothetical protein